MNKNLLICRILELCKSKPTMPFIDPRLCIKALPTIISIKGFIYNYIDPINLTIFQSFFLGKYEKKLQDLDYNDLLKLYKLIRNEKD